jgi:hypothetical protein
MTIRGIDWVTVGAGTALGAVLLAGCVAFAHGQVPLPYARAALAALAGASAFVLDDPAAEVADAAPTPRQRRTTARCLVVVLPLTVWAGGVLALDMRVPATPVRALLVQGTGTLAIALAAAAVLRAAGRTTPGELAATAVGAAVLAAGVTHLGLGPVVLFPLGDLPPASTTLWATAAALAALLVNWTSRDPYRTHPDRRPTHQPGDRGQAPG